jgi:spermidine/putrescine transport system permease protein
MAVCRGFAVKLARWLSLPAFAWFLFFIFAPLVLILGISLAQRGPYGQINWGLYLTSYSGLLSPTIARVLGKTVLFAGATSCACVALGILAAWAMAAAPRAYRETYLALIAVPFLTNGLIRILGLKSLVSVDGPLDTLLNWLYIPHDPFALSTNGWLVAVGMVSAYLPFAVLPLYGAFERFDFTLIEAAQDLGANSLTILWSVVLPTLARPITGAAFLVFIPSLGEYLIPDLLGGAKTMLLGNLITDKFLKARDWPAGAALAVAMIVALMICWLLIARVVEITGKKKVQNAE